eukprot:TRINITY_DN2391_c0_g1_i1.p1 TRINITY_DN2391_c0_g1~~TRINITY_DN2391_c0_g1_i1.p1  ORF type:complete len:632 (+),score=193.31 TRINITY_DN2391_c0_g1_i1:3-1898(+)
MESEQQSSVQSAPIVRIQQLDEKLNSLFASLNLPQCQSAITEFIAEAKKIMDAAISTDDTTSRPVSKQDYRSLFEAISQRHLEKTVIDVIRVAPLEQTESFIPLFGSALDLVIEASIQDVADGGLLVYFLENTFEGISTKKIEKLFVAMEERKGTLGVGVPHLQQVKRFKLIFRPYNILFKRLSKINDSAFLGRIHLLLSKIIGRINFYDTHERTSFISSNCECSDSIRLLLGETISVCDSISATDDGAVSVVSSNAPADVEMSGGQTKSPNAIFFDIFWEFVSSLQRTKQDQLNSLARSANVNGPEWTQFTNNMKAVFDTFSGVNFPQSISTDLTASTFSSTSVSKRKRPEEEEEEKEEFESSASSARRIDQLLEEKTEFEKISLPTSTFPRLVKDLSIIDIQIRDPKVQTQILLQFLFFSVTFKYEVVMMLRIGMPISEKYKALIDEKIAKVKNLLERIPGRKGLFDFIMPMLEAEAKAKTLLSSPAPVPASAPVQAKTVSSQAISVTVASADEIKPKSSSLFQENSYIQQYSDYKGSKVEENLEDIRPTISKFIQQYDENSVLKHDKQFYWKLMRVVVRKSLFSFSTHFHTNGTKIDENIESLVEWCRKFIKEYPIESKSPAPEMSNF